MGAPESIQNGLHVLAMKAADAGQHDVALDALREASKRPGVQTSEFYLSIVTGLIGTVLMGIPGKEVYGAILTSVSVIAFNLSRGIAKAGGA